MSTVTFDTLELVARLKTAGFQQEQAEAVVRAIAEAHDSIVSREYLDMSIKNLESRLEVKISDVKSEMIKWFAGMMLAQAGLIAALVKLL